MPSWNDAYYGEHFSIETNEPSKIVRIGLDVINPKSNIRILDLGCGNGRNSIYAAQNGGTVDAVDIANLEFLRDLPLHIQDNIHFYKQSVTDLESIHKRYNAVIATRLIQYLNPYELHLVFGKIRNSLISDGLLMLSTLLLEEYLTDLRLMFQNTSILSLLYSKRLKMLTWR